MVPSTVLQKKVAALSEKLPEIRREAVEWAYDRALDKQMVQSRGRLFCLECGHKWKPEIQLEAAILGCTCPVCGQKLKLQPSHHSVYASAAYVSILDTTGGMQVERVLLVKKQGKKLMKPVFCWHEVMQRWTDDKGNVTIMTIGVNGMSYNCDAWSFGSHMEVRLARSSKAEARHDIGPYKICTGAKVLPVIRRNGFRGSFHGLSPHVLFPLILNDNKAETLLKAKQIDLLKHLSGNSHNRGEVEKYWPSVRICIRNKYQIKDASMWTDYMALLEYFGKDLRSQFYVCPDNLKEAHDRYVKKKKKIERERKLEELKKRIAKEQKLFAKQKGKYFGLCFTDGKITVKALESIEEFMIEGDELDHCLFEREYFKKEKSLILSARIDNKPVETIEVSLERFRIEQARGANNKSTRYHKRILNLVNSNMQVINQTYNQKQAV